MIRGHGHLGARNALDFAGHKCHVGLAGQANPRQLKSRLETARHPNPTIQDSGAGGFREFALADNAGPPLDVLSREDRNAAA